ncbi:MAG: hypothetical protein WC906_05340 [Parcubacteria group bacterium]|jgi:hypothetical protein
MGNENKFMKPPEKKTYKARAICSMCHKEMGERDGFPNEGGITHLTCDECAKKMKAEYEELKNPLK